MTQHLTIVLAQQNWWVGNVDYNLKKHIHAANEARDKYGADVIVFSELSLTGYPPEDLLFRPAFLDATEQAMQQLIEQIKDIYCVVGHPYQHENKLYNACSLIYNGKILGRYDKTYLPNYGVFDEYRYFTPGKKSCVVNIKGLPVGLVICEDLWESGPVSSAAAAGARLILSPNASPFEIEKHDRRLSSLCKRVKEGKLPIFYVNQVGGQDELIFDGDSMVIDTDGNECQSAGFFNETLKAVTLVFTQDDINIPREKIPQPSQLEKIYQALVMGVKDYVTKNYFKGVLIGVSGGIDSALTTAIAVDALGKNQVEAVIMPSRHTAKISLEDAAELVANLDINSEIINIELAYQSFLSSLAGRFADLAADTAEENIQARCRAVILMALSNKFGKLVLTTGNRSELAVGYCTLYGDMAGGFNVLKDVPKTLVYQLANYRNRLHPVIPLSTINRAPTAELAPNQKDQDTLPPYPVLDNILDLTLNQEKSIEEIIAAGFDSATVRKVVDLIRKNEYKRRQSPIGPRINNRAFGRDRRYPTTNGFKG